MSDTVTLYTRKTRTPFIVDADDVEAVGYYSWHLDPKGYLRATIGKTCRPERRRGRAIRLHQFLLGLAPNGLEWDHENRDKLDNRRCNLRPVTSTTNMRNVGLTLRNKSGVKGVAWRKEYRKWRVRISVNGVNRHIGLFAGLDNAAAARRSAELELWG